ncbi:MAG: hypothetical protein GX131_07420 [candidate division WS1 bacterium]|jgi:hypothetical protein|nr:hypothetical protein [candidate division WS1 bacterium]
MMMLAPTGPTLDQRPRAVFLRLLGFLLLIGGLVLNISLLVRIGGGYGWRLGLMLLAPGIIMLVTAWLVENTPSMRGCLTFMAVLLAALAGFWAWVGIVQEMDPEGRPPEMLREAPVNETDEASQVPDTPENVSQK